MNEAKNRDVGFKQMLDNGLAIYFARTNLPWPGKASVVVHQIHFTKAIRTAVPTLNDMGVSAISADLTDGESWSIRKLSENTGRMFQGSILSGEGFKIDAATAQAFLAADLDYGQVVFPFIVGDTINNDPRSEPICWVICFWDWPQPRAQKFKGAFDIVEKEVQPERKEVDENGEFKFRAPLPDRWWQYGEKRPGLYHAIGRGHVFQSHPNGWTADASSPARVLAVSTSTTKYPAFTYLSTDFIYSNTLCLLADDRLELFAALSSDIHTLWAWSQRTTRQNNMDSMRYAHGLIFETFPFPEGFLTGGDAELSKLGDEFYQRRQAFMEDREVGLTGFYNLFHDRASEDARLVDLRSRQSAINVAVLARYGWTDVDPATGFHEVAYLPAGRNTRFTVSEPARIEIFKRLARLNNQQSESQGEEPQTAEAEQGEPLEEGLFAPREATWGTGGG